MSAPETTAAEVQPAIVVESTAAPANLAVPTAKTPVTPKIFTDAQGHYTIISVRKNDGTTGRVKRRIPGVTEVTTPKTAADTVASGEAATEKAHLKTPNNNVAATAPNDGITNMAAKTVLPQTPKTTPAAVSTGTLPTNTRYKNMGHRFMRNLASHVTRNAAVFGPDWNLGDLEEGDEPYDPDDDSDDSDDGRYESDDERDNNQNNESGNKGTQNGSRPAWAASSTGTRALSNAAGRPREPLKYSTTSLEKDKLVEPVQFCEKTAQASAKITQVPETKIVEIKVDNSVTTEKTPPLTRQPQMILKTSNFVRAVVSSILIGFPLLFILLGIITTTIQYKTVDDSRAINVKAATSIAISAWPIVFAAIVSQSLRTLATWSVERGIKLMRLEQLISSNSVAAAVKQPFFLRRVDFVSIGLLALWSLSPIASQAMQKMSLPYPGSIVSNFEVWYVDTTGVNPALHIDSHNAELYDNPINIMFGSAMLPRDVKVMGIDSYNNTIIPILERIPSPVVVDGWTDVTSVDYDGFSTIIGIPFEPFPSENTNGLQKLNMSSSYLTFTCSAPMTLSWAEYLGKGLASNRANSGTLYMTMGGGSPTDGNFTFASMAPASGPSNGQECTGSSGGYETTPGCFNSTLSFATCTYKRAWVDSMLDCDTGKCLVTRMRTTPNVVNDNSTLNTMRDLSFQLANAEPQYFPGRYTIIERYINDPSSAFDVSGNTFVDLRNLTAEAFTQRFAILVNTYWQIGFSPIHIANGVVHNGTGAGPESTQSTAATYTDTTPVYYTDKGWLAALFISASLLLLAGIASIIFESLTVGPDVLGFASSIVRQSKYVRIPDTERGGSTMSGAERARNLGNLQVMMQDVRGDRDVGRIALGTVEENSQRLRPGRLYR